MKVLVVIVAYNAMKWVDKSIGSVLNSTIPADLIVIDNGSKDGTIDHIKTNYPSIILRVMEKNLGFGQGNNVGLQYAIDNGYDYVYLLNQDAWIMPDTLERLITISAKHPEYGILSPFQLQANLEHIDVNFKRDTCSYKFNSRLLEDLYFNRAAEVYEVPDVMAAHWFMTIDCIRTIGGFSTAFRQYAEDNNYCHRCLYKGIKIGIIPSMSVVHDRESRIVTDAKAIYIKYTHYIASLSNPLQKDKSLLFKILKMTLKDMVHYKSFLPMKYYLKLLTSYKEIRSKKLESITKKTPFLKLNSLVSK